MKTFDKKDVFSWANCEEAKQYIGKEGCFAHSLSQLDNRVQNSDFCTLEKICDFNTNCFCRSSDGAMCYWSMFLPADKVKEVEEKKYRPFKTFEEFKECTHRDVGDVIVFKKRNTEQINITLVTGYHGSCLHKLVLGCMNYSFQELFHDYLWLDSNNEWQPFGVLKE